MIPLFTRGLAVKDILIVDRIKFYFNLNEYKNGKGYLYPCTNDRNDCEINLSHFKIIRYDDSN